MAKRRALRFGAWLCAVASVVVCINHAVASSFQQRIAELTFPTTSYDTFKKMVPKLKEIKPGDAITGEVLGISYYELTEGGLFSRKTSKVIALADGWIPALSGGGRFTLGKVIGLDGNSIIGHHVFGYVYGQWTLVPKYELLTKAPLITDTEYESMRKDDGTKIIRKVSIGNSNKVFYFNDSDVRAVGVRELPFQGMPEATQNDEITLKEVGKEGMKNSLLAVYKQSSYENAESELRRMKEGIDTFQMINQLNGFFMTHDYGRSYVLYMNGYANYEDDKRWLVAGKEAIYEVWPFGFVEGNSEVVKLAVVFRNGCLYRIEQGEAIKTSTRRLLEGQ